jgi:hypothetical protein
VSADRISRLLLQASAHVAHRFVILASFRVGKFKFSSYVMGFGEVKSRFGTPDTERVDESHKSPGCFSPLCIASVERFRDESPKHANVMERPGAHERE